MAYENPYTAGLALNIPIVPATKYDQFATHYSEYSHGGYREVANTAARFEVPTDRLNVGMMVIEKDTFDRYVLIDDTQATSEAGWRLISGDSERVWTDVEQAGHSLTDLMPVYWTGSTWAPAKADDKATLKQGIVWNAEADRFDVVFYGLIRTANANTVGNHYLSIGAEGTTQTDRPTQAGELVQVAYEAIDSHTVMVLDQAVVVLGSSGPVAELPAHEHATSDIVNVNVGRVLGRGSDAGIGSAQQVTLGPSFALTSNTLQLVEVNGGSTTVLTKTVTGTPAGTLRQGELALSETNVLYAGNSPDGVQDVPPTQLTGI